MFPSSAPFPSSFTGIFSNKSLAHIKIGGKLVISSWQVILKRLRLTEMVCICVVGHLKQNGKMEKTKNMYAKTKNMYVALAATRMLS